LWVSDKKEEAASQYQQALAGAPEDQQLYIEIASLFAEMGAQDRRVKVLESAPQSTRTHTPFIQALAAAYVDTKRFADAVTLLTNNTFTSGEGEDAALGLYRKAHLGLARIFQQEGKHAQAADEFAAATEYPRNFGVGRPGWNLRRVSMLRLRVSMSLPASMMNRCVGGSAPPLRNSNSPTQPEEPWSEHYFYKAVALEHVGRKAEARALYERLARLNDEKLMLDAEPWPPTGAIRFALAGSALKALGRPSRRAWHWNGL
jgi:tetratricopeptide (TPR) repeat protein